MTRRRTHKRNSSTTSSSGSCLGYCVKCRCKRNMTKSKRVKTRNNRFMMKGICPNCGTKMNKFI